MGRPSSYDHETAAPLLAALAEGEPLTRICKRDDMPAITTVYLWMLRFPEFAASYERAREAQAHTLADETLAIADDGSRDYKPDGDDGGVTVDHDHIARSKLRVDTRKWFASKMLPKKYGERTQVEHSGTVSLESLIAGSEPPAE